MLAALSAALAIASSPTEAAPPDDFCTVLETIIAAEDQPSPFASLVKPAGYGDMEWSKAVIPGYRYCAVIWIERGRAVSCSRNLAPPELTATNLAQLTSDCLGATPVRNETEPGQAIVFEHPPVRIQIEETCTDACHVGRRVSFTVMAQRPRG